MKKIKPLRKKHRFIQWLKKFLGIKQPSKLLREFGVIDEMHTVPPFTRQVSRQPKIITVIVTDDIVTDPIRTDAEINQAIAEKLAHEIVERELLTIQKSEDPINFRIRYRATITIFVQDDDRQGSGEQPQFLNKKMVVPKKGE